MTGEFSVAVHSMVYLTHRKCTLSSEMLAKNVCTHPARIRKIMAAMKRSGLVSSKGGKDGGYMAVPNSASITLRQIADALEDPIVGVNWRTGSVDMSCVVCSGMGDVMEGIGKELDELCRQRLSKITLRDIGRHLHVEV